MAGNDKHGVKAELDGAALLNLLSARQKKAVLRKQTTQDQIRLQLQGVVESFAEFAQDTTAHGVKFFFQGKKLSRVCFFVVWLAAVVYTCYTCYKGIVDYKLRPTGTKFEIDSSFEINLTFPTISLCNINKIRKDYLDSHQKIKEIYNYFNLFESSNLIESSKLQSLYDVRDSDNLTDREDNALYQKLISFKDDPAIDTTIQSIYEDGGPLSSDIITCKVGFRDCSDILGDNVFERIVSHQGNCFKINPNGLMNAFVAGNIGGLTLFLHAQHDQYDMDMVRLVEPSEGFKISFHDHKAEGNVGNTGFVVSPGLQYFIQLSYQETKLLQQPYGHGDCESDPEYRSSTCMHRCIHAHIVDTCGCVPYTNDIGVVGNTTKGCTLRDMFTCVLKTHTDIIRNTSVRNSHCDCNKACRFKKYDHSVSSSLLSNSWIEKLIGILQAERIAKTEKEQNSTQKTVKRDDTNWRSKWRNKPSSPSEDNETTSTNDTGSAQDYKNLKDILNKRVEKWSTDKVKENVVVLKISFPSIEKHTVNQVVTYGLGNLLGDIGGVLGLFLGGSVFTVLEFLDYFVRMIHENIVNLRMKKETEKKRKAKEAEERIMRTLSSKFVELGELQVQDEQDEGQT